MESFRVSEGEKVTVARWLPVTDFSSGERVLYPDGLAAMLLRLLSEN